MRSHTSMDLDRMIIRALRSGDLDTISHLIKNGMDPNKEIKNLPLLLHACKWEHEKIIKYLIKNGANIHIPPINGYPLLMVLYYSCGNKMVEFLINMGINIDIQDKNGETIIFHIAQRISELMRHIQSIFPDCISHQKLEQYHNTSHSSVFQLLYTEIKNEMEFLQYIISRDANLGIRNYENQTVIEYFDDVSKYSIINFIHTKYNNIIKEILLEHKQEIMLKDIIMEYII